MAEDPRARVWVFTLNNYTPEDEMLLTNLPQSEVQLLVIGRERGVCGTPHLQGTIGFTTLKSFKYVAKIFDGRAHVEKCKNIIKSLKYCRKDGDMLIDSDDRHQEKRSDWTDLRDLIKEKASDSAILEAHPGLFLRHSTGIKRAREAYAESQDAFTECKVFVIRGESGCGKTRICFDTFPDLYRVTPPRCTGDVPWFDGYNGQKVILFDDYRGECNYSWILQVCDGYPLSLEVKGASVRKNWTTVLFTTNLWSCNLWYPREDPAPFERRSGPWLDMEQAKQILSEARDAMGPGPEIGSQAVPVVVSSDSED